MSVILVQDLEGKVDWPLHTSGESEMERPQKAPTNSNSEKILTTALVLRLHFSVYMCSCFKFEYKAKVGELVSGTNFLNIIIADVRLARQILFFFPFLGDGVGCHFLTCSQPEKALNSC